MATNNLVAGMPTQNGTVVESDFSYETPDNEPQYDINAEAKDVIAQIAEEFAAGEHEDNPAETEPAEVETDGEPQVEEEVDPAEAAPEVEADEVDDPKLARGIQRVVARELAAKEAEARAEAKLAELKAMQSELASIKGLKSTKELAEKADFAPVEVIKALGKDPETFIKLALAQHMGDSAPEELKKFAEKASTQREIDALKSQLANQAKANEAREYYAKKDAEARQYVHTLKAKPDSKTLPTLSSAVAIDADYVHREIMEEVVRDAQIRAAQDPDGEPMSFADAARNVEARWAKLKSLLVGKAPTVQNGKTVASTAQMNGKKPASVSPPNPKPPAKPLAPWMKSGKDIYDQGLEEAMREFHRVEAERKAKRG